MPLGRSYPTIHYCVGELAVCGLVGVIDFAGRVDLGRAEKARLSLRHRGPDAEGSWYDGKHVYLGHNRLSIIDLSEQANQPLFSRDKQVGIVFNGEIYNYRELRKSLAEGAFGTRSDTEVILQGYLKEGVRFFKKLRGIYAFAILDRRDQTRVVLARDPAGVKPLYVYQDREHRRLAFASEIKALKKLYGPWLTVNEVALKQFLNLGFVPEPFTAYNEIRALRPGHYLIWEQSGRAQMDAFLCYRYGGQNALTFEEISEQVDHLLRTAVRRNLIADVEVSVALSGGIDSALVYYHALRTTKDVQAITVSFTRDPDYDESGLSREYTGKLAGASNHKIVPLEAEVDLEAMK